MAKVEFEIPEGHTALSGIAVIQAADEEGKPYIFQVTKGSPKPVEQIGLLSVALDQIRYTFTDKDIQPEELFGDEDDDDEDPPCRTARSRRR